MITLTEKAVEKIRDMAVEEDLDLLIRAKVFGGGCAGFTNDFYFETNILDSDEVFEQNGIKLVVDQLSYQYLDETIIDYVESSFGGGFKFLNPNISSTCGCGKSFSV